MKRFLMPLSAGFQLAVTLRSTAYRRGWLKARRLARPVVSVGNLAVGGTGKTPFAAFVAERLRERGWRPAILTRGYGRRHASNFMVIEPASARSPDPREVGDEPALLARMLPGVPIVVGVDRFRAGRLAEERFGVSVHILDDGFQHLAIERDVNILLLDVTQGLSEAKTLPLGKFREPPSALKRADMIVLTRTELENGAIIKNQALRINPSAKLFSSHAKFCGLRNASSENLLAPQDAWGTKVLAFCGIGNPGAFFANLRGWGFSVSGKRTFSDHHAYNVDEMAGLEAEARRLGVDFLVTTEKDAVNFPSNWTPSFPVKAAVIHPEMAELRDFEEALFARLDRVRVNL